MVHGCICDQISFRFLFCPQRRSVCLCRLHRYVKILNLYFMFNFKFNFEMKHIIQDNISVVSVRVRVWVRVWPRPEVNPVQEKTFYYSFIYRLNFIQKILNLHHYHEKYGSAKYYNIVLLLMISWNYRNEFNVCFEWKLASVVLNNELVKSFHSIRVSFESSR